MISDVEQAACGQRTKKGAPCRLPSWSEWPNHWPPRSVAGTCKRHLSPEDRATYERLLAEDLATAEAEQARREPACWTWVAPTPGIQILPGDAHSERQAALRLRDWQRGVCAICGEKATLVCDHDHDTGLVRGWLCTSCNSNEDDSPVWNRYRSWTPTSICGVRIRYWERAAREFASPRGSFNPWAKDGPRECLGCGAPPKNECDCPPLLRVSPAHILKAIMVVIGAAKKANLSDIRYAISEYVNPDRPHSPEFLLVRDLILRRRTSDFLDRWCGNENPLTWLS
ncbi:endonuclease domain-containing protein [Microbispora triticiradicis]|uniref:endonuclease domain-containing protein n=1 Tax=Microbispora TaxID=2005 RepID=UPI0026C66340